MRRLFVTSFATLALSTSFLAIPVHASPGPEPEPVTTSTEEVAMGSVEQPAPDAEVQSGPTEAVSGVPSTSPTLTVSEPDTDPFSLVGVTWAHDPEVTDTVVQVRVRDASGAWGDWTEVGLEDAEQNAGADSGAEGRGGTAPLWTGPSTGVEVELVTRSGAEPTDVQLDLVDPGTSEADTSLGAPAAQDTAQAALSIPPVYSRTQWGADEGIRTWEPEYASTIKAATLHHTADSNGYTADQVPAMMRSIYRYHSVSRGWGDIGYNVIVDKYGRIWEGRYGGLASTVIGAHAGGFNTSTFGVSMLGDYSTAATPTAMIDAVSAIIAWKLQLYGVNPHGSTQLTSGGGGTAKFAAGVTVTLPTIFGHRDVGSTTCPGQYGYAQLGSIRAKAAALMNANPAETIASRYADDAGLRQLLGAPQGEQQTAGLVTWQVYDYGRMYSSPGTGVHFVVGTILGRYLAAGGPAVLGAPITDELPGYDGAGRFNHFSRNASIFWTGSTGAQVVWGDVRKEWARLGSEVGPLGYPTSGERALPGGGGIYQSFQSGTMYWSPATGAREVHGSIAAVWQSMGGPTSSLGLPTTSETATPDGVGRYNHFANGASIYYSPAGGVRVVWGGFRALWARLGWEAGPLGYPRTAEAATTDGSGTFQLFLGGGLYWTPAGGPRSVQGVIAAKYHSLGGESSQFGLPTTDEMRTPDGRGWFNHFSRNTSIYFTPATGAHEVHGSIRTRWAGLGWERSTLGYPTSDEKDARVAGARVSEFVGGRIYWSEATGAQPVFGAIGATYLARGGETSDLGLPTSGEYSVPGGIKQDFQRGAITLMVASGQIRVG